LTGSTTDTTTGLEERAFSALVAIAVKIQGVLSVQGSVYPPASSTPYTTAFLNQSTTTFVLLSAQIKIALRANDLLLVLFLLSAVNGKYFAKNPAIVVETSPISSCHRQLSLGLNNHHIEQMKNQSTSGIGILKRFLRLKKNGANMIQLPFLWWTCKTDAEINAFRVRPEAIPAEMTAATTTGTTNTPLNAMSSTTAVLRTISTSAGASKTDGINNSMSHLNFYDNDHVIHIDCPHTGSSGSTSGTFGGGTSATFGGGTSATFGTFSNVSFGNNYNNNNHHNNHNNNHHNHYKNHKNLV
jgi:hypothetical protein